MREKYYVGVNGLTRAVFLSASEPTQDSHGHLYKAVIGAFRTKRGAEYMARYGRNNPHCQTVAQAEKLARDYNVNALGALFEIKDELTPDQLAELHRVKAQLPFRIVWGEILAADGTFSVYASHNRRAPNRSLRAGNKVYILE